MKNRIITTLIILFAVFYISFVTYVTDGLHKSYSNILKSKNVIDVTEVISTRINVTPLELKDGWTSRNFNDHDWEQVRIPSYKAIQKKEFVPANFIYYRIVIPRSAFEKINHLKNESFVVLQSVFLSRFDVFINEKFYKTFKPINAGENKTILPVNDFEDNIISIKGYISAGDTGIDSRDGILLGKGVEFNEIYRADYKAQTAFPLVFILSKGSILFLFCLMYLLVKVDRSFDKFFIFGICAVVEELIAGDYLYGPLNFNQMVYLYSFVNFVAGCALFLFFSDLTKRLWNKKILTVLGIVIGLVSLFLTIDAIYTNHIIDISKLMRFWNYVTLSILCFYLVRIFRIDRGFGIGLLITIVLYLSGALVFDIGMNLKAYGNLLLFSMVAYQTFGLFRREQDELQLKKVQLLEQEKDVAIAKTASLLAHDVRKPLEQIKMVFDKITSNDYDPQFLKIAKEDIDQSVQNVNQLVNQVMDLNKSSDLVLNETSFYRTLSHALKQVMSVHDEMNITLEYDFKAQSKILADQKSLTTALVNLISNAVEAIRDIGGKFEGKIRLNTYQENDKFYFRISNDGPQIPEHVIGDIFKPLFTHGKANGTGLGLASVSKTITQHKGSISVSNLEKGGVAFDVVFIAKGDDENFQRIEFLTSSKLYSYSKPDVLKSEAVSVCNVLILDNETQNIESLKSKLSRLGILLSYDFAENQDEVFEKIQKKRYELYFISRSLDLDSKVYRSLSYLNDEIVSYASVDEVDDSILSKCEFAYKNRPKVLFVDDTKMFRIAWQSFHGSHNIECKGSPEDALAMLNQKSDFDVFVLDYHFSNSSMNGLNLGMKIIEQYPQATILIASSADEGYEDFQVISKRDYDVRKFISERSKT